MAQGNRIGPIHHVGMFTEATNGWIVAEASDFGNREIWGRVFQDACDEGFHILGNDGTLKTFTRDKDLIIDGEVCGWEFREYRPRSTPWNVVIYND